MFVLRFVVRARVRVCVDSAAAAIGFQMGARPVRGAHVPRICIRIWDQTRLRTFGESSEGGALKINSSPLLAGGRTSD